VAELFGLEAMMEFGINSTSEVGGEPCRKTRDSSGGGGGQRCLSSYSGI
jgi:hypothetical protein